MKLAILGCGQLAQMMAHAANELSIKVSFIASENEDIRCVEGLGKVVRIANNKIDVKALYKDLGSPHVITVEREDVSIDLLRSFQTLCKVHPNPDAIEKTQHRFREKQSLCDLDIPVAPFRLSNNFKEAQTAINELGLPVFIKSCEQGYDGKNQWRVKTQDDLNAIENVLNSTICVIEAAVNFSAEVSFIAARSEKKKVNFYAATENDHHNGILITSIAPSQTLKKQDRRIGESYLMRILEQWDYVGVLAMECFLTENGLIINELAPRVHNSGHWTMDSRATSQFENHIRAVCGLPLGDTEIKKFYGMFNLLGTDKAPEISIISKNKRHSYNKTERPGRKMGHINLRNKNVKTLIYDLNNLKNKVYSEES